MTSVAVSIEGVSKSFDDGHAYAVRNLSLQIGKHEFLALVGGSGSGKTTTLKMINVSSLKTLAYGGPSDCSERTRRWRSRPRAHPTRTALPPLWRDAGTRDGAALCRGDFGRSWEVALKSCRSS